MDTRGGRVEGQDRGRELVGTNYDYKINKTQCYIPCALLYGTGDITKVA